MQLPQLGDILNNSELINIFKVSPQGRMLRLLKTNSLVIVSNQLQMKYMFLIITLLLLLVGCKEVIDSSELVIRHNLFYKANNDTPFTGSFIEYYGDGSKKVSGSSKDGLRDGVFLFYYLDGRLMEKMEFKNGIKTGLEDFYYQNGQLRSSVNYVNGKKEGLLETFYDNGNIESRVNYVKGKKEGVHEFFALDRDTDKELYEKLRNKHGVYMVGGSRWGKLCYQNGEEVSMSFCGEK